MEEYATEHRRPTIDIDLAPVLAQSVAHLPTILHLQRLAMAKVQLDQVTSDCASQVHRSP